LTGSGRDARNFRSIRKYKQAEAAIDVDGQQTYLKLRPGISFLVADGHRDGVQYFLLDKPLRNQELDLLNSPGDSLALLSLLPPKDVEIDEEWSAPFWSAQMLTRMEALLKQKLSCKLTAVKNRMATVEFEGDLEGATGGSTTKISIRGSYQFNLQQQYMTAAMITQVEKSEPGPVSPGTDVTATVTIRRSPADAQNNPFSDFLADHKIPLDPTPEMLRQQLDIAGAASMLLNRDWHVFHQSQEMTVLRYLNEGSLIAQCNISTPDPLPSGAKYTAKELENQVRKTLGSQVKAVKDSGSFELHDGTRGYYCLAQGSVGALPMYWLYYMCVAADGRRTLIAFTLETKLQKQFGSQAVKLMEQFRFVKTTDH